MERIYVQVKVRRWASIELASLKEEEEGEKSIFDRVWFSRKTTVLDSVAKYSSIISHVDNDGEA